MELIKRLCAQFTELGLGNILLAGWAIDRADAAVWVALRGDMQLAVVFAITSAVAFAWLVTRLQRDQARAELAATGGGRS